MRSLRRFLARVVKVYRGLTGQELRSGLFDRHVTRGDCLRANRLHGPNGKGMRPLYDGDGRFSAAHPGEDLLRPNWRKRRQGSFFVIDGRTSKRSLRVFDRTAFVDWGGYPIS